MPPYQDFIQAVVSGAHALDDDFVGQLVRDG
jgi:hypothetical protein